MNPVRKFFLKLALFVFILILVMSIWKFGQPVKLHLWGACGIFLLLGIAHPVGRFPHALWRGFVSVTTAGMRFFTGIGLVLLAIGLYRWAYTTPPADFRVLIPGLPAGDFVYWCGAGGLLLLAGLIRPAADALFAGWMWMAGLLQAVMSRVVLTIVYILAVLPVGLTARIVGKKFLTRAPDPEAKSYWLDREAIEFDPARYNRHF